MKKILSLLIVSTLCFLFVGCQNNEPKETVAPLVDLRLFFKNPEKASFRISKDGKYFSYRADFKGKTNIFVQKAGDSTAIRVSNDTLRSIGGYFWKVRGV